MSFAIGIPTLNRYDLLEPSLNSYKQDFKGIDIHVIDNGFQSIPETENRKVYTSLSNIGVARSWNTLCNKIFDKHSHAVILNDDVYLGYGTETVESCISKMKVGFATSFVSFSVFIISKEFFGMMGGFDETFYPAYFEDSDFLYRMKLKGIQHDIFKELNPRDVLISGTYEKNPNLVNDSMKVNRERYINKWGNIPMLETFTTPYNK